MADDAASNERFKVMERKLYRGIMLPAMVLTIASGLWLWLGYGIDGRLAARQAGARGAAASPTTSGWASSLGDFARDANRRSPRLLPLGERGPDAAAGGDRDPRGREALLDERIRAPHPAQTGERGPLFLRPVPARTRPGARRGAGGAGRAASRAGRRGRGLRRAPSTSCTPRTCTRAWRAASSGAWRSSRTRTRTTCTRARARVRWHELLLGRAHLQGGDQRAPQPGEEPRFRDAAREGRHRGPLPRGAGPAPVGRLRAIPTCACTRSSTRAPARSTSTRAASRSSSAGGATTWARRRSRRTSPPASCAWRAGGPASRCSIPCAAPGPSCRRPRRCRLARAPGRAREFAFAKLARFNVADLGARASRRPRARNAPSRRFPIFGSDLYGRSLGHARAQPARGGPRGRGAPEAGEPARARRARAATACWSRIRPTACAWARRSSSPRSIRSWATRSRSSFAGWTAYIFSGDPELAKLIRLQPSRKTVLFNGALECRLYEYRMVAGGNRPRPRTTPAPARR